MRPPRSRTALPLALSLTLLTAACAGPGGKGDGADGGPGNAARGGPAGGGRPDEHLRSLPYVSWDEKADASLSGVTLHDARRASPGFNLHTNDVDRVILSDMAGTEIRSWSLPPGKRQCEYAELLPDGGVIVECVDQSVVRLASGSRVAWDLALPAHHDIQQMGDGSFLVPYLESRIYEGRDVGFDGIARVDALGQPAKMWSTWERFDELRSIHGPSLLDTPPPPASDPLEGRQEGFEYYHLNSIQLLPATPLGREDRRFEEGNLLVCLRNIDTIAVLDRRDFAVTWSWGEGNLDLPHMPRMTPEGTILIFDNGTRRGWSRVIEIRPPGGEIVWSYEGRPRENFFSKWRGAVQRLPNGNTLITESERGHVFEVTPEKETVWELWNPEIVDGKRKRIYRMLRFPPEEVEGLAPPS
jgi:hypothetical protein